MPADRAERTKEMILSPGKKLVGYDVPWKEIQALLVEAALRTSGIMADSALLSLSGNCPIFTSAIK